MEKLTFEGQDKYLFCRLGILNMQLIVPYLGNWKFSISNIFGLIFLAPPEIIKFMLNVHLVLLLAHLLLYVYDNHADNHILFPILFHI